MRHSFILISSCILLGLGLSACSKESSKKQPRLRGAMKKLGTPDELAAQQANSIPTSGAPTTALKKRAATGPGPQPLEFKDTHIHISRAGAMACEIDKEKEPYCSSTLVSNEEGAVVAFHFDGSFRQRDGKDAYLFDDTEIKTVDDVIVAKRKFSPPKQDLKLRVIQVITDSTNKIKTDELPEDSITLELPENLTGLGDGLEKLIKESSDKDHFVMLTDSVKLLQNADNQEKIKADFKRLGAHQKELVIADVKDSKGTLDAEKSYVDSFTAILKYEIIADKSKDYDAVLTMNNQKLTVEDEDIRVERLVSTQGNKNIDVLRVTILPKGLTGFSSNEYEVKLELTEK